MSATDYYGIGIFCTETNQIYLARKFVEERERERERVEAGRRQRKAGKGSTRSERRLIGFE